jgi:hypothetical protein
MERNLHLISKNDLIKLINNQGEYRKFYVELGEDVRINFKHIRPRKRKGDKIPSFSVKEGGILTFD